MLLGGSAALMLNLLEHLTMPHFSSESLLIALSIFVSAAWGLGCGICERLLLAPRRRFSLFGPSYVPAMVFALLAGCYFLTGEQGVRFFFALLMAAVFFGVGALPALAAFQFARWILRTRFSGERETGNDSVHRQSHKQARQPIVMIRVIDSIRFDEQALGSDPKFLEKVGPGLLVTLDLEQRASFLVQPGTTVRVRRPDGSVIDRVVGGIEVWRAKVGLFFPNTEPDEIPNLSEIELPA